MNRTGKITEEKDGIFKKYYVNYLNLKIDVTESVEEILSNFNVEHLQQVVDQFDEMQRVKLERYNQILQIVSPDIGVIS
jgi:hypothetical protein